MVIEVPLFLLGFVVLSFSFSFSRSFSFSFSLSLLPLARRKRDGDVEVGDEGDPVVEGAFLGDLLRNVPENIEFLLSLVGFAVRLGDLS